MANNRNRSDDFDDFSNIDDDYYGESTASDATPAARDRRGRGGRGGGGGLRDAFRNRPGFRLAVLAGLALVIGAGVFFFVGGGAQQTARNSVGTAGQTTAPAQPGQRTVEVEQNIQQADDDRVRNAQGGGTSAVPQPGGNTVINVTDGSGANGAQSDPLTQWRDNLAEAPPPQVRVREPEPQPEPQQQAYVEPVPQEPVQRGPDPREVAAVSDVMLDQMNSLVTAWTPQRSQVLRVVQTVTDSSATGGDGGTGYVFGRDRGGRSLNVADGTGGNRDSGGDQTLVNSGTILYAQLLNEANSDVPGPVLAEVLTGPMSGSSLIGRFETSRDMKYIVITFSRLVVDEDEYDIEAIAVDPNTSLPGMATETDGRYFDRLVLPAAAAFVQGFAEAISQVATNSFIDDGAVASSQDDADLTESIFAGITLGAGVVGNVLTEEAQQTQRLVRVAAGTPIGVFFIDPMTEGDLEDGVDGVGGPRGTTSAADPNTGASAGGPLDLGSIGSRGGPSPATAPVSTQVNLPGGAGGAGGNGFGLR